MPNITELVRSEGYLYKNPTNLSDPSGYGTQLGYTESGIMEYINPEIFYSNNEEYGNNVWRKFYLGNNAKLLTIFRNFNTDVMGAAFPGQVSNGYELMGTRRPGDEVSDLTYKLIFIPSNLSYPCVYIKNASADMYPGIPIRTGHSYYTGYPVLIDALPKSASATQYYQKKLIGDIVL